MKLFLLTTVLLCSLIASAQTAGIGINEATLPYNSTGLLHLAENSGPFSFKQRSKSKSEPSITSLATVNLNSLHADPGISQAIPTDSSVQKSSGFQGWYKLSLVEFGLNFNTAFTSASASSKWQYGQALLNYSMGFSSLGGLGFGTKLIVYYPMPDNVELHSWVPLYAYFPVYISKKKTRPFTRVPYTYNIPFMINLYAGGSLWNTTSSSYSISKGAFLPGTYFHIGVDCMFLNYNLWQVGLLNGNFALDTGMFFYKNKDGALTSVYNIGLIYTFAGSARVMYK
jgi:hypothetical protein